MGNLPGVQCDRCHRKAECEVEREPPLGWVAVQFLNADFVPNAVGKPFDRPFDLCPECVTRLDRWWDKGREKGPV